MELVLAILVVILLVVLGYSQLQRYSPDMKHTELPEPSIRVWLWKDGARKKEFYPINMEIRDNDIQITTRNGERHYDPDNYDEVTVEHRP